MTREPMSGVDLAWLRMERPTNPMMIVAVLTLGGRVKRDRLKTLLLERLMRFERFREMPAHDVLGTHWESDPRFDLDAHLRLLKLPSSAGQSDLEAAASRLASRQLDVRRPLWQIHLVERYRKGSAIIARFHHCYADGIALMRVLLSLTDPSPRSAAPQDGAQRTTRSDGQVGMLSFLSPITNLLGSAMLAIQSTGQGTLDLMGSSLQTLAHPQQAAVLAQQIGEASRELAGITLLPQDPPTSLKRPLSRCKQVAWAEPLQLGEVKAVAAEFGCTVNDILLATAAGALRSSLKRRDAAIDRLSVRALVPVNLRPADEVPSLGNEFGLVFAALPIGERHPVARLFAVHQEMEKLKRSSQALVSLWLLTAMGLLPGMVEDRAIELFTSKASVVISNVPGPRQPLYLAGARIEEQYFWVPQAGSIGVGISLLSYDGRVHFGMMADRNLIAEPREVARAFVDEFEKLVLCALSGIHVAGMNAGTRTSP